MTSNRGIKATQASKPRSNLGKDRTRRTEVINTERSLSSVVDIMGMHNIPATFREVAGILCQNLHYWLPLGTINMRTISRDMPTFRSWFRL